MLIYVKSKRVARHDNYKEKKIVYLREMKLDHRNYLDLDEKTCFQAFRPCKTQTNLLSWDAEILRGASLSIILSWEQTTKPLSRLCGCVGWSAPLMFACSHVRFLSTRSTS